MIQTLFLDAGGVLLFPNWTRASEALAAQGVRVDPEALAAADPHVKLKIDNATTIAGSTDHQRSFPYFDMILDQVGVPQSAATDAALAELRAYHAEHNLWERVPDDVVPALARFRRLGLQLVVVSNSNGTLPMCLDRLELTAMFHNILDSQIEGVEKPDARIFEIALERAGAGPGTTMHVGDLYHVDVMGARNARIQPMLLDAFNLYETVDCPRVRSLGELADRLEKDRQAGSI